MIDGTKIQKLRIKKGITQYKMAYELGVMPSTLGIIESGKNKNPGILLVISIAEYLGVTVNDLICATSFPQR